MALSSPTAKKKAKGTPSPRKSRRKPQQERSQHTVDAILAATKVVVSKEGIGALTTNRVARLAGVSIGSLYQYFPSKRALITELRRRHQAEGEGLLYQEIAQLMHKSVPVALRRFVERMLEVHKQDPALHKALESEGRNSGLTNTDHLALKLIRLHMEHHRDEIGLKDLDQAALVVGLTVEAITHGTVLERPHLLDDPSLVDGVVRMLLSYLQHPSIPPSAGTRSESEPAKHAEDWMIKA